MEKPLQPWERLYDELMRRLEARLSAADPLLLKADGALWSEASDRVHVYTTRCSGIFRDDLT